MTISPKWGYLGVMARKATDIPDIKVRPTAPEKRLFLKASEAARMSLNQWMIQAALEKIERDGKAKR